MRDFEQLKSLNYIKIFALMVRFINYKALFTLAAVLDWDLD